MANEREVGSGIAGARADAVPAEVLDGLGIVGARCPSTALEIQAHQGRGKRVVSSHEGSGLACPCPRHPEPGMGTGTGTGTIAPNPIVNGCVHCGQPCAPYEGHHRETTGKSKRIAAPGRFSLTPFRPPRPRRPPGSLEAVAGGTPDGHHGPKTRHLSSAAARRPARALARATEGRKSPWYPALGPQAGEAECRWITTTT